MNIQMNEFHSIDIHNITSPSIDEFHEEWTWTRFMISLMKLMTFLHGIW
jgi:hypothetical protein